MIAKIDNARYEVAVMWEDRLMEEMGRLKIELESCYAEDRAEALKTAHTEKIEEIACLTNKFNQKEKELREEVCDLFVKLEIEKKFHLPFSDCRTETFNC